jgi:hypothetical protein
MLIDLAMFIDKFYREEDDYPFTDPAVKPETIYLWKMKANITGGRAANIPPAIMPVVFIAYLPMNSAIATGAVF